MLKEDSCMVRILIRDKLLLQRFLTFLPGAVFLAYKPSIQSVSQHQTQQQQEDLFRQQYVIRNQTSWSSTERNGPTFCNNVMCWNRYEIFEILWYMMDEFCILNVVLYHPRSLVAQQSKQLQVKLGNDEDNLLQSTTTFNSFLDVN